MQEFFDKIFYEVIFFALKNDWGEQWLRLRSATRPRLRSVTRIRLRSATRLRLRSATRIWLRSATRIRLRSAIRIRLRSDIGIFVSRWNLESKVFDLIQSSRMLPGASPNSLRNTRLKYEGSRNPVFAAISFTLNPVLSRRIFASLTLTAMT